MVGLSSISRDDSTLLPYISLSSGDKWGRTWFEDSSDFSNSINSSSWLGLANTLLRSFLSGDDPTLPLSPDEVLAVSLSTGENSGLS